MNGLALSALLVSGPRLLVLVVLSLGSKTKVSDAEPVDDRADSTEEDD